MTYAGFWRRVGAMMVDSLIYSVLIALILGPKYVDSSFWSLEGIISNGIALSLTIVLWVRYLGTPGKLLLGCLVVDADSGERMTVRQAMIRYLGYFVSIFTLGIGFLWVAWDKRKQGFHDKMANTVVVYNGNVDVFDESQKSLSQLISEVR